MIVKFEDSVAWQKSRELVGMIYSFFKSNRDYGFRDQATRAAVSVLNNIAEGFERQTNKEFRQFLYIAKGSCGEVRSLLYIALDLRYITSDQFARAHQLVLEVARIISGLIKTL